MSTVNEEEVSELRRWIEEFRAAAHRPLETRSRYAFNSLRQASLCAGE